jgi:hypothetical protein
MSMQETVACAVYVVLKNHSVQMDSMIHYYGKLLDSSICLPPILIYLSSEVSPSGIGFWAIWLETGSVGSCCGKNDLAKLGLFSWRSTKSLSIFIFHSL